MSNLVFAFGPGETYVLNAPQQWARRALPPELQLLWDKLSDIICAAFGPDEDQYFMSYYDKSKEHHMCCGDGVSPKLVNWLSETEEKTLKLKRSPQTRVALGPNHSFFAWDADSVRWSNIPEGFEDDLQKWLSPAGWISGPPRLVALGADGGWFALSEYGNKISLSMRPLTLVERLLGWVKEDSYSHNNICHVSLHPTDPDQYLIIRDNGAYSSCLLSRTEAFYTVIDSLSSDETITARKAAREKEAKEKRDYAESEKGKAEAHQRAATAAEACAKAAREAALLAELPGLFVAWKQDYEKSFSAKSPLTIFPSLPRRACFCAEMSCLLHKNKEGALMGCRHDVERLLRASGLYSQAWLRKQSLAWHPDRFGLRCDPDHRKSLCAKATELYVIFGQLIESENENNSTPPMAPGSET